MGSEMCIRDSAIAASEVAIGLAIFLAMYGKHETISLDDVDVLRN